MKRVLPCILALLSVAASGENPIKLGLIPMSQLVYEGNMTGRLERVAFTGSYTDLVDHADIVVTEDLSSIREAIGGLTADVDVIPSVYRAKSDNTFPQVVVTNVQPSVSVLRTADMAQASFMADQIHFKTNALDPASGYNVYWPKAGGTLALESITNGFMYVPYGRVESGGYIIPLSMMSGLSLGDYTFGDRALLALTYNSLTNSTEFGGILDIGNVDDTGRVRDTSYLVNGVELRDYDGRVTQLAFPRKNTADTFATIGDINDMVMLLITNGIVVEGHTYRLVEVAQ